MKEREFLDRVNISELSDEEKLKFVEQIMPDRKFDEIIIAHERIAYERGVADGYAEAIEEGKNERPQGEQIAWEQGYECGKNEKRPQGEWIYGEDDCGQDGWFCSECNFFVPWYYQYYKKDIDFIRDYKACPHCLAEMVTYTGKDRDTKGGAE